MPGSNSMSKGVKCPFWTTTDGMGRIVCECFCDDGAVGMYFAGAGACRRYRRQVCSQSYRSCPLYVGLMLTKYRE